MRAREAAKIFVDDGMTDLIIFLSLAERVEEEGMAVQAVQVHRLAFVSFARHIPETRQLPISREYIIYCNDITPLQLHHYNTMSTNKQQEQSYTIQPHPAVCHTLLSYIAWNPDENNRKLMTPQTSLGVRSTATQPIRRLERKHTRRPSMPGILTSPQRRS
jgi:hypothetical protein